MKNKKQVLVGIVIGIVLVSLFPQFNLGKYLGRK